MSSGGLANGADPRSMAPPTARLRQRLAAKDAWPQGREAIRAQDQNWNSGRDRGPGAWAPGRERPQEQGWNSGRDRAGQSSQDQAWMSGQERGREQAWPAGSDPGGDQTSSGPGQRWGTGQSPELACRERGHVWRPGNSVCHSMEGQRGLMVSNTDQR